MFSFVKKMYVRIFVDKNKVGKKFVTGKKIRHFLPTFFLLMRYTIKAVVKKFSFSELKIQKVKLFTQS